MKYMKKTLCLVLVVVLALALAAPAMAASITITNPTEGQTYNAYKIFDVTNSGSSYAYTISTSNDWFEDVQDYATPENKLTLTVTATDATIYNVSIAEGFDAAAFAAYLNTKLSGKNADATGTGAAAVEGNKTPLVLNVATPGYYFVDSSMGALCILNTAVDNVEVTEKNQEPTIDKKVNSSDSNTAKVGDTLTYTITITAGGAADTTYVVHDTMSNGLTLNQGSFTVKVGDVAVDTSNYSINFDPSDDCTFEITFNQTYTASLEKNTQIVITYTAVVNENAVIGTDPNTNEAILDYGNSSTPAETTNTYSYKFDVVKTDDANKVITGAKFKLYDAQTAGNEIKVVKTGEGQYRVATAAEIEAGSCVEIEAGQATISGLSNGTYWLEETAAPAGYNILESRVSITIENANNTATVTEGTYTAGGLQVINEAGQQLPSTGGIGTTIFYTLGGLLVVGAVVLLVTKKRMSNTEA